MRRTTLKNYPRSMPFHPPPETAEPPGPSRWTFCLACLGVAALALLVIAGLFLLTGPERQAQTPRPRLVAQPVVSAPPPVDSKPADLPREKPPAEGKNVAPPPSAPVSASLARERYLEALGGLAAAHLYQSFLNIGLLADAVENESYASADAEKTLAIITELMKHVDGQLERVAKTGLDAADQRSLERIRRLTSLLRTQVTALTAYWATGDLDQAERYHEIRTQAWTALSEVLGLQERNE